VAPGRPIFQRSWKETENLVISATLMATYAPILVLRRTGTTALVMFGPAKKTAVQRDGE